MLCTTEEDLTQDIWVHILQFVLCKQRLNSCALVCQKLARAAAAATKSVKLDALYSPQRLDAFLSWTSSHGSSLTKLSMSSMPDHTSIRQLPCPNLLELDLSGCSVQLCAGGQDPGLLHSCTALTKLILSKPNFLDGDVDAPAGGVPAAVAQLQHFRYCSMFVPVARGPDGQRKLVQALGARLLPHLTLLTCLDLVCFSFESGDQLQSCFSQHVSSMVCLKELQLMGEGTGTVNEATLPGIERLTALDYLSLGHSNLEPSCLLRMSTSLTELKLQDAILQPHKAQQDSALGASQLLQLLGRCSALQALTLSYIRGEWPQQLSAYSALTASSRLQELQVYGCSVQGAAWAHVFPAGRKLPHLRSFETYVYVQGRPNSFSADIASLVSCCPALETLDIAPSLTASLAPLTSFTALTNLALGPIRPTAVGDLTALTQLQALQLWFSVAANSHDGAGFGVRDLLPLTALKGLTSLCSKVHEEQQGEEEHGFVRTAAELMLALTKYVCDEGVVDEDGFVVPVSLPDVWVQLLERCEAADQASQPAVDSSMARLQLQEGP